MHIINLCGLYILLVMGLTLLLGFTGQISLGQAGFAGLGAYISVSLTLTVGLSFWPALLIAGLVCAGFSLVIGPVLKARGHVLALATLAFAEIGRLITLNWTEVTGGPMGIPGVPPPTLGSFVIDTNHRFYYLILAAVIVNYAVLRRTIESRVGRAMKAIRDDQEAAAAVGVNVLRYKIMAFAIAGFFAGISGALFAHLDLYVSPDDFGLEESIKILTMTVIGGIGSFTGSILGAITLVITNEYLHRFQQYSIAIYGLMMILILIFAPGGLYGLVVWLRGVLPRRAGFIPGWLLRPGPPAAGRPVGRGSGLLQAAEARASYEPGRGLLEVKGVTKRFGGLRALSDVSLTVEAGSIWGLIGPNGAGKTTLFNVIAGVFPPTSGRIHFRGRDITRLQPHRRVRAGVARTFQNIKLFRDMTVLENVMVGFHVRTRSEFWGAVSRPSSTRREEEEIRERGLEILDFLGIYDRRNELAGSLPYGPQRALEIGRSMATRAEILLLDEPTAGMTPQETQEIMSVIERIRGEGYTILLIEHDMSMVMNLCERIAVLDFGEKIAEGAPDEIQSNERVIEAYLGKETYV
ncbi:MAG: branched-chain amino acid ABC transporter ATP-binding protein/permease [bacterium]